MNAAFVKFLMAGADNHEFPTLDELINRPAWHAQAACRGLGPDAFIRGPKADYSAVMRLCGECAVRQECLEAALADSDLEGCWGGTTDAQRRAIRKRRVA